MENNSTEQNKFDIQKFVNSKVGVGVLSFVAGAIVFSGISSNGSSEPVPTATVAAPEVTVTETAKPLPAVTVTKKAVDTLPANKKIEEGVWTVGIDVVPGTYRVAEPVTEDMSCYWEIDVSGTNGEDIVANDNVSGGRPTITLRKGQDVVNHNCGTFIKVG